MRRLVLILAACGSSSTPPPPTSNAAPATTPAIDAAAPLDPKTIATWPTAGCFMIRDASGKVHESGPRCEEQRRPYSTFKIANALIGLDAGVLENADSPMTWDKARVPDEKKYLDSWRKPHTLRTGIAVSAVPYFRTLALDIGEPRMKAGLEAIAYGNRDISGELSKFWLVGGGLRISAREQLAFVTALAEKKLAVSKHAQEVVADVTTLAKDGDRVLHGKTGSGPLEHGKGDWIVWQVGWVESAGSLLPYACWLESTAKDLDDARAEREAALRKMLAALDVFTWP